MISLESLLPQEIADKFSLSQKYRAEQVFLAVSKGKTSLSDINIPTELRDKIASQCSFPAVKAERKIESADGSAKFQFALADGAAVESVVLTDKEGRKTICLSSQVGCAMACAFCQTGRMGFERNLDAGEIAAQFFAAERECGRLDNAVFMGMGEPLANLDCVRKAIEILSHPKGRAFGKGRITLSSCGLADKILDLAENGPHVRLAVSLTVSDEEMRKTLMPAAARFSLAELKEALFQYRQKTGLRPTLECALIAGKNCSLDDACNIAQFAKGLDAHINLIPWNAVEDVPFKSPSRKEVASFQAALEGAGISTTVRYRRGDDICGACGQLGRRK